MPAVHHCRHSCSHSSDIDTGAVTVTLPLWLPGGVLIVVLAFVDHWHRRSFISLFSRLLVVLSAGALVPASCHVPFVQLIVMMSVGASSTASHHAACPLMPPLHLPLVFQQVVASPMLSRCRLLLFSQCATSTLQRAATSVHFSSRLPLVHLLVVMLHLIVLPPPCIRFCPAATSRVHSQPTAFICTGWLLHHILLRYLPPPSTCQHRCLSTRCCLTLCGQLHIPFASCLPQLVAVLPLVALPPHIHQLVLPSASTSCRVLF
jgi:hypothetical protein